MSRVERWSHTGALLHLHQARDIFKRIQRYPNYGLYVADAECRVLGVFALLVMDNVRHLRHMSTPLWSREGRGRSLCLAKSWESAKP